MHGRRDGRFLLHRCSGFPVRNSSGRCAVLCRFSGRFPMGQGHGSQRQRAALCSFHSGCRCSLPHRRFQFFVENRSRRCAALCRFSGRFPVGQRHRVHGLRTGLRGRRGGCSLLRRWFRFSTGNGLGKCAALRRLPRRFPVGQRYSCQRQRTALHGCRSGCSLPRRRFQFFVENSSGRCAAFPVFLRHLPVSQGHSRGGKLRRGGARWLCR